MANFYKGESSFTTEAGVTYHLVMDFAAFVEASDVCGLDVDQLLKAITPAIDPKTKVITKKPRISHVGALLYGALTARHPEMTHRDAINLFAEGQVVGDALGKALEGAMPKQSASAGGKAPPRPRGTGTKLKQTGRAKA